MQETERAGTHLSDTERRALETFYDFEYRALAETANMLSKGITFYLAILAAVVSYAFTQDLSPAQQRQFLVLGVFTSLVFALAAGSVALGLYVGISDVENALCNCLLTSFRRQGFQPSSEGVGEPSGPY